MWYKIYFSISFLINLFVLNTLLTFICLLALYIIFRAILNQVVEKIGFVFYGE
jgi:hypothetical protein